jgi:hypothetical protein
MYKDGAGPQSIGSQLSSTSISTSIPSLSYCAQQQDQWLDSKLQDLKAQDRWRYNDGYCTGRMNKQTNNKSISPLVRWCLFHSPSSFRLLALLSVILGLLPSLAPYFTSPSAADVDQDSHIWRSHLGTCLGQREIFLLQSIPLIKYFVASTNAASSC